VEITGRVAIVTGAGSGIGRACASELARRGASVLVADVDDDGAAATVGAIEDGGGTAVCTQTDVSNIGELSSMFDTAVALWGGVDILCNNAGIVCGEPLWPDTAPTALARQVAVNLGAVIVGTRIAVNYLAQRDGGAIVNIASIGALLPLEDEPGYSATKAGVAMFTRACAGLARSHRIRVNAVLPGLVDTPLLAKSGDGSREAPWAADARQILPLLTPADVAEVVAAMIEDDGLAGQCRIVGELPEFVTDLIRPGFD
jgi:NAD(P)-dependent dehydrogenase (short-subunit alcohol dehydrogenase family)